jgi:hypothetical protein
LTKLRTKPGLNFFENHFNLLKGWLYKLYFWVFCIDWQTIEYLNKLNCCLHKQVSFFSWILSLTNNYFIITPPIFEDNSSPWHFIHWYVILFKKIIQLVVRDNLAESIVFFKIFIYLCFVCIWINSLISVIFLCEIDHFKKYIELFLILHSCSLCWG